MLAGVAVVQTTSMGFENPVALVLVLATLPLLLFHMRVRRLDKLLAEAFGRAGPRTLLYPLSLGARLALMVLIALAAAQPYIETVVMEEASLDRMLEEPATILLLVDVSRSMEYGDRWARTEAFIKSLVESLGDGDELIVAVFSREARAVYVGPPSNFSPTVLRPGERYTSLAAALGYVASMSSVRPVAAVIVTDGSDNVGGGVVEAAGMLRGRGLSIAFVHVGEGASSNPLLLMRIAVAAGGAYYEAEATDPSALARSLYESAKVRAVRAAGRGVVLRKARNSTPASLAMVAALALIPLAFLDGA